MQTVTFTMPADDLRAIHATAADDGTRFYLHGYHVTQDAGGWHITASDGYALLRIPLTEVTHSGVGDDPFNCIIPRLDKRLPKSAVEMQVIIQGDPILGRKVFICATSKTGKVVLLVKDAEEVIGKFPDCALIIPDASTLSPECPAKCGMNMALVSRVTDVLGKNGFPAFAKILWEPKGAATLVQVSARPDVTFVVMPGRW